MARTRDWTFVVNNYTDDDEAEVLSAEWGWFGGGVRYIVCGKEVGESGTPHLQGFVQWVSQKTNTQVRAFFDGRGHWEPRRGTPAQARDYITANPDKPNPNYWEFGNIGNTREEAGKQSMEERWSLAKEGKFEALPPEQIKVYEYIHAKFQVVEDRDVLDNIWIYGPSGCGKSLYVRTNYPSFYNKGINKWWDGYRHEPTVLVDDLDPNHAEKSGIGYYLKIWGDHYAFNAEVKGGMLRVRPKTVIVTSQYTPREVFKDFETVAAITRRFKVMKVIDGVLYEHVEQVNFNH